MRTLRTTNLSVLIFQDPDIGGSLIQIFCFYSLLSWLSYLSVPFLRCPRRYLKKKNLLFSIMSIPIQCKCACHFGIPSVFPLLSLALVTQVLALPSWSLQSLTHSLGVCFILCSLRMHKSYLTPDSTRKDIVKYPPLPHRSLSFMLPSLNFLWTLELVFPPFNPKGHRSLPNLMCWPRWFGELVEQLCKKTTCILTLKQGKVCIPALP